MIEIHIKHQIFTSSGNRILEVNEQIEAGSMVHVSGDSGIGKTVFFKIMAGLLAPDFGVIKMNDRTILDTSSRIFLPPQKRNISLMFQNYALFPHMTVRQNIAFAQKETDPKKIDYLLDTFNLGNFEHVFPSKLSGGQQQRIALARALVQNAEIVLLDEPLSAVDPLMRKVMMDEIVSSKDEGSTVLITSHNEEELNGVLCEKLIIE
ncbi:ATP-binding cassette domain-containing protein [Chryseobacterium sp. SL1]|uniref:ATP-binding cassette domain-containing protein n=1 Tax=Chryseobacterium sp. SL1 TaxID=2995159 RepID=UPI0022722F21|nr:ATP-binding cassette domain-containing protein [Chryseobacterium sp. SL1]MCY1661011.1 ATP-binding cassette domain-containing protein [Chryseobacterium sp. SL1]